MEYFVEKYESTLDVNWKEDALIDISRLREDLRQQYLDRLNAEPVSITDIQITLDTLSIDKGETVNGLITATPANNTQMSAILLDVSGGAKITTKAILGNTIHFTIIGETSGTAEITAGIGDITDTATLTINEVQAPAEQVKVSNLTVSPSSPNVGDEIEVSWTASKNGSAINGGFIKIWTNLTSMPDAWTSVSQSSYKINAVEPLTSIYIKVATDADGADASATSVCEIQVSIPVVNEQIPIYMFSFIAGGDGNSNWHRYDSVFGHHINTLYVLASAPLGSDGPVDGNGNATSLRPLTTEQLQSSECVTELLSLNSATWNTTGNMNESYSKIMTLFDETTIAHGADRAKYGIAYGNDTICAFGWSLDNGKYRVRFLSTYDSYSNDPYAECNYQNSGLGKIYLNYEDVTSQLGSSIVSFADNTEWSDSVEVEVTGGELIVSIFNKKTSVAAERTRMNVWGIEITKL